MAVANLPPLKADTIRTPVEAGVWERDEVDLGRLAAAMDTSTAEAHAHQLKSIPDAWAQVQIARQAFAAGLDDNLRPRHVAYPEVIANWRALLALFALAHEYRQKYQLTVTPITLPPAPREGASVESGGLFAAVLALLKPSVALHPSRATWSQLGLISVQQTDQATSVPVGLATPDLLVTPGKALSQTKFSRIDWFEDGPKDPTKVQSLKARDFYMISRFVEGLITALETFEREHPSLEAFLHDRVLQELRAYRNDCNARTGDTAHFTDVHEITQVTQTSALHASLRRAPRVVEERYPVGHSECLLRLRTDVEWPFKGVVLLDTSIAEQVYQRPANSVVAWRHRHLSEASDPAIADWIRKDAAEAGYLVVTAEDFFAPEMVRLEPDSVIPGHRKDYFHDALLPLSPLALMLMMPGEVLDNLRHDQGPNGEELVTLTVPLKGEPWVTLPAKRFSATPAQGDGLLRADVSRPVNLAVWPDFQRRDWHWNLLQFQHAKGEKDLQIQFGLSAVQIATDLGLSGAPPAVVARAREWIDRDGRAIAARLADGHLTPADNTNAAIQRLRFQDQSDALGELQISKAPFEALCFSKKPSRNEAARPVGMVILPRQVLGGSAPSAVAIDFGTTNTVVATTADLPGGAHSLLLKNRAVFPLMAASETQRLQNFEEVAWPMKSFMPIMDQPTPVPTVVQSREIIGTHLNDDSVKADRRPLFAGNIFFFPAAYHNDKMQRRITANVLELRERLVFGLKWEPDFISETRAYLRQLMLMSGAELAAHGYDPNAIVWRFSYPEAQRGERADSLEKLFRELADQLFPRPGAEPARVQGFTESEAAGKFFLNMDVVGSLSVVLDIGGGTTDIAIWLNDGRARRMVWHGSIKIAGGDFLTHYLVNNPTFLDRLQIEEIKHIRTGFKGERSDLRAPSPSMRGKPSLKQFAELFYSDERFPGNFIQAYSDLERTPLGDGLRHTTITAMGGLLYYVGKVIRHLMETNVIRENQYEQPTIAFGGRGALFLRTLGGTNPNHRLRALGALMARGAGLDPAEHPTQVFFSPEPKLEVVLGMTRPDADQFARGPTQADRDEIMLVGEKLELSGDGRIDPWADVNALAGRELLQKPSLDEFEAFLTALFEEAGISLDLNTASGTMTAQTVIRDYVNGVMNEQLSRAAQQRKEKNRVRVEPIEPPFILALRALLDRLGQSEEERARFLSVDEPLR